MQPVHRKILYSLLVLFCVSVAGFIFLNGKSKVTFPMLKERVGALATSKEWEITKEAVAKINHDLQSKPEDAQLLLSLAKEFMQEGRITGDYSYYNKASLDLINGVLNKDPENFEAMCFKSMIFLSQHRFDEGKVVATEGMRQNPYNSFIYGLLVDANVELGDYKEAVAMSDKMVSVRPDIRSYSRISYLREIHGDIPGAIEAIKMAISAGYPGYEETEWARMVLGHLYEETNDLKSAEMQYLQALEERPEYPFALAGLGRIAHYKKDYKAAIQYYEHAKNVMSDASFFEALIDLYRLDNQAAKADQYAEMTLNALLADNITASKNKDEGHFSDKEIADIYLKKKEYKKAVDHAMTEWKRRPQNIDACETLAWIYYVSGQADKAAPLVKTALRTNSQNPELLVKSGLIMIANGQEKEGRELIQKGMAKKPYMDESLVNAVAKINK